MDKLEETDLLYRENRNYSNNNSVFESPDVEDKGRKSDVAKVVDSKLVFEMRNFAGGSHTSVGSDGRRLESEEFENISISAVENIPVCAMKKTPKDALEELNRENINAGGTESEKTKDLKAVGDIYKKRGSSFDSLKFENVCEVIAEEDVIDGMNGECIVTENGHVADTNEETFEYGPDLAEDEGLKDIYFEEPVVNKRFGSEYDSEKNERTRNIKGIEKNKSLEETSISKGSGLNLEEGFKYNGRVISIKEHYGHMMELRRRSESGISGSCDKPPDNYRKHSSGDLHSRLKTRKLLGVGETDDGDVHRSKLSQILGHSDQLYIRLPSGLRLWQIVLAVVFSVLSLWALLFPGHYFHAMYDMDGSSFTFPIRLYACALICISVMYWSTVHAADRDVIRMILLSSVVFFTLQSGVLMSSWLPWLPSTSPTSFLCSVFMAFVARLLVIAISSYFYWITYKDGKSKDVKYYR
ncbi:uncharacterized protein LOC123537234 isoform X2 [Mercenaria mercenaria]|uniref:uncharacterized protein LOC123537234 isoform X2 n=1 Tax=Mercenaria mercenaria TaxID=6596 RepID=UPI00234F8006|nr:uncharacterized protein LOC123537234 isoform X2 [Mercenaria mercenaria]